MLKKRIYKFGIIFSGSNKKLFEVLNSVSGLQGFKIPADSIDLGHRLQVVTAINKADYIYLHVHEFKRNGNVLGAEEDAKQIQFLSIEPPEKVEFVLADFSLMITEDFALFCNMSGNYLRNKSKANLMMNMIISSISAKYECSFVELSRKEVIAKIKKHGVKEIKVPVVINSDDLASILENEDVANSTLKSFVNFLAPVTQECRKRMITIR